MTSPPFSENFRFTGPHTAISCTVEFDHERECWHATGSGFHGPGESQESAAIACFTAWLTRTHGWYSPEDLDNRPIPPAYSTHLG